MADADVPVALRLPGGVSVCSSRPPDSSPILQGPEIFNRWWKNARL